MEVWEYRAECAQCPEPLPVLVKYVTLLHGGGQFWCLEFQTLQQFYLAPVNMQLKLYDGTKWWFFIWCIPVSNNLDCS